MNIGLIDVDGHARKKKWGAKPFPNLALAKLARYHRSLGDNVEWYDTFQHYDIVYMSKIFSFTPDYLHHVNADRIVRGGTGYDITSRLPDEVDRLQPDYSIYPMLPPDTAYGFLTRGCVRKCPWCVVPRKEGMITPYMDVDEIAIEGRHKLVLMDNNILASGDYGKWQLRKIAQYKYAIDFNQGLDARLIDDEWAALLAGCRWIGQRIRMACDTQGQIKECERAMQLLNDAGFKGQYFLYVLLDDKKGLQECYDIVKHWWTIEQERRRNHGKHPIYPHCQPYLIPGASHQEIPQWQKDMAGWTNKRMIYVTTSFEEFSPRKGFKCKQYFNNK